MGTKRESGPTSRSANKNQRRPGGAAPTSSKSVPSPGRRSRPSASAQALEQIVRKAPDMAMLLGELIGATPPKKYGIGDSALDDLAGEMRKAIDVTLVGGQKVRLPYLGELNLAVLRKCHESLRIAVEHAERFPDCARALRSVRGCLAKALDFFPDRASGPRFACLKSLRELAGRAKYRPAELPNIQQRFEFTGPEGTGTFRRKTAKGRLGIPGKVFSMRSGGGESEEVDSAAKKAEEHARKTVSQGIWDDAGHLIGDQFGALTDPRDMTNPARSVFGSNNLSLQNKWQNEFGTWYKLEKKWAEDLKQGFGFDVTIVDAFIVQDVADPDIKTSIRLIRPISRRVTYIEIAPDGQRRLMNDGYDGGNVIYGNFPTSQMTPAQLDAHNRAVLRALNGELPEGVAALRGR